MLERSLEANHSIGIEDIDNLSNYVFGGWSQRRRKADGGGDLTEP